MSDTERDVSRDSRAGRSARAAANMAAEIVPKWSNESATNTMDYESQLNELMVEGYGPVDGLMHAVYQGDIDSSVEGYMKFQLLKLDACADAGGTNEVDEELDFGADPVAAYKAPSTPAT